MDILEDLQNDYPNDDQIQTELASAYAELAEFDILSLLTVMIDNGEVNPEDVMGNSFRIKYHSSYFSFYKCEYR